MVSSSFICRYSQAGNATGSILESMKNRLLQLTNENHINNKKEENINTTKRKNSSEIRNYSHSKKTVNRIQRQPDIFKSAKPNNNYISTPMLTTREDISNKKSISVDEYQGIHWTPDLTISSPNKTSLEAKSEFDILIKDWISTNWLNTSPIIQQRPCHILIHDKLIFPNLDLFDTINNYVLKNMPELKNISYQAIKDLWDKEMTKMLQIRNGKISNFQIERNFKEIIKNVYISLIRGSKGNVQRFNNLVKDSHFINNISIILYNKVTYDKNILDKLKNIQNLNERNDLTIIKDDDLAFIPSLKYNNVLTNVNIREPNPLENFNVLQYKSVVGNKVNDYENLESLKNILINEKLHCNEKFLIITGERATSLEYYRLLKLFNKTYSGLKLKGCVIYLNSSQAQKNKELIDKQEYTGKEMYYVVEEFSEIYDIIEVL